MARRIPLKSRIFPQARAFMRRSLIDVSAWTTRAGTTDPFHSAKANYVPGSQADGADILEGEWHRFGQSIEAEADKLWTTELPSLRFADWLHSFEWLEDIAALDVAAARVKARQLVDGWVTEYGRYHSFAWEPDLVARRLNAWMLHWSPVLNTDNLSDLAALRRRIAVRQGRFLRRNLKRLPKGISEIRALVALSMLGARWARGDSLLNNSLGHLSDTLAKQVRLDGAHISRSPETTLEVLTLLRALDALLDARGLASPTAITRTIDRLAPMVGFFSHTDGGLAMFNGGGEGNHGRISKTLADLPSRPFAFAPHSGFQRLERHGTVIIMDVGDPPPFPYDAGAHISPLAFEMSVPEGRLITSCGYAPEQPTHWREPVRQLSAHSTLDMPAHVAARFQAPETVGTSITSPVILRGPEPVKADRREAEPGVIVEGSHHGFVPGTGLVHHRRLFLSDAGDDVRGEDRLALPVGATNVFEQVEMVALRFHLHPDVTAALSKDGRRIWLKMDDASDPWVFLSGAHPEVFSLNLESSAYLGTGHRPFPTQQIVIMGTLEPGQETTMRWALRKRPTASGA